MIKKMILWASLLTVMALAQSTPENPVPQEKHWDIHAALGVVSVKGFSIENQMGFGYFVSSGYSYSLNISQWWHFVLGVDLLFCMSGVHKMLISEFPIAFYLRKGNNGFYMPLGITLSDYS